MKENLKQLEAKENILHPSSVEDTCTVHKQEEILPSSIVEDTCTVYNQKDDTLMEYTEIKGKHLKKLQFMQIASFMSNQFN